MSSYLPFPFAFSGLPTFLVWYSLFVGFYVLIACPFILFIYRFCIKKEKISLAIKVLDIAIVYVGVVATVSILSYFLPLSFDWGSNIYLYWFKKVSPLDWYLITLLYIVAGYKLAVKKEIKRKAFDLSVGLIVVLTYGLILSIAYMGGLAD